jgi:hypothetical protein
MTAGSKISGSGDGGVHLAGGSLDMQGGEISGNSARNGAGVLISAGGSFTMDGGEITGNRATANGGGVAIQGERAALWFNGGAIHANSAGTDGGGIYMSAGSINMLGNATIHFNRAGRNGGGIGLSGGDFRKRGGTITGPDSPAASNSGTGAVVGGRFVRNNAAGPTVNLDTNLTGRAGGWDEANVVQPPSPPVRDIPTPRPVDYSGTWRIVARNGMYIHIEGNRTNNGAAFHTWTGAGGTNAQFRFEHQNDGTYIITAVHSGRAMDIQNHNSNNGVRVHQWERNNNARNQRWHIIAVDGGFVSFRNDRSGLFLDVPGNRTGNGHKLQQWQGNTNEGRHFRLVRVN